MTLQFCSIHYPGKGGEPPYAILSHRWQEDEVSYTDFQDLDRASKLVGFRKIKSACEKASESGIPYLWIDTCCINKDDSAEVSESINSMFAWYRAATICYAYLYDVEASPSNDAFPKLSASEWFTRGWTLQELLAPPEVILFDRLWVEIGTKTSLSAILSLVTRIPEAVLCGRKQIWENSVAQRLSWMAGRTTKKEEDQAYSLLGIFDVNMSLLYGEGDKAFRRLQEKIIEITDDHTILAWPMQYPSSGLLASQIDAFKDCQSCVVLKQRQGSEPFAMTNRGMSINLDMTPWEDETYLAFLRGAYHQTGQEKIDPSIPLAIFLRRVGEDDQYVRYALGRGDGVFLDSKNLRSEFHREYCRRPFRSRRVLIRAPIHHDETTGVLAPRSLAFQIPPGLVGGSLVYGAKESAQDGIWPLLDLNTLMVIDLERSTAFKQIALGFDFDFNPVCFIVDVASSRRINVSDGIEGAEFNDHENGCVYSPEDHDGIWRLRGDRLIGLDVILLRSLGGDGPVIRLCRTNTCWRFEQERL